MTEVLHFPSSPSTTSPSSPPSSSSSTPTSLSCAPSSLSCAPTSLSCAARPNAALLIGTHRCQRSSVPDLADEGCFDGSRQRDCEAEEEDEEEEQKQRDQLSLLALLVDIFRKSLVSCKSDRRELCTMEIGLPTNVRHVAHVTFDRFNGFLGLPVEFEPEVPRRAPSASATVFGVSTESMQLSYDSRGNCVPTILLLMQNCLYAQGGLHAEGIFRITAENSEEEAVREQLNRGVIPDGVDVHCLAGLIKAWFRELPTGVLDSLSPEQVMHCETEEEYVELVRLLPPTEGSLLDWAINLMADVAQHEHLNKMNSRNIAMVFAPNMTQMADPLTALMYAVQVMNFLRTLIERTLREREDSVVEPTPVSHLESSDESGHQSPSQSFTHTINGDNEEESDEIEQAVVPEANVKESVQNSSPSNELPNDENPFANRDKSSVDPAQVEVGICKLGHLNYGKSKLGQSSELCPKNLGRKSSLQTLIEPVAVRVGKTRGISNLSRIDSRTERIEAWR